MTALVRAELLKIRTTRMVWGLLAGTLALCTLGVFSTVFSAGTNPAVHMTDAQLIHSVYGSAAAGSIFVLVLGILGMAGEYRHQTITQAFLLAPRRERVVAAKLLAYAILGVVFALAAVALTIVLALPVLAANGYPATLADYDIPLVLLGSAVATAIYAVVGVGVGALIRNQIAAILISLAWLFIAENLITAFVPELGKWLPGGAQQAVTYAYNPMLAGGNLLPAWAGGLLLVGYGLAFALAASLTTVRRDIT
ncbi:MAG: ABC transporter permease [Streptosporangiaceae bacterium]